MYKIGTATEKSACNLLNLKVWLPGMGSNHDNRNHRRICKLQSRQWSKMPESTRKTTTRTQLVHGDCACGFAPAVDGSQGEPRWFWESAALKRLASAVRFRPWPPCFQSLTNPKNRDLVTIGHNFWRVGVSLKPLYTTTLSNPTTGKSETSD